jgi:hypothetical protein
MENPPLWVWAIIVVVLIGSKFIYRWALTKRLANSFKNEKQDETKSERPMP